MGFVKDLKIGAKLALGFGLVLALVVVLSVYAITALNRTATSYQQLLDGPYARYIVLESVDRSITDMRHQISLIALHAGNQQGIDRFSAALASSRADFDAAVLEFRQNVQTDIAMSDAMRTQRTTEINAIVDLVERYATNHAEPIIEAARAGNTDGAVQLVYRSLIADDEIDTKFHALFSSITDVKNSEAASNSAYTQNSIATLTFVSLGIFVGAVLVAIVITKMITKPISTVVRAIKDVSDGKLNVNIRVDSKDETGELSQNALNLISVIKNIMDDLSKAYRVYMEEGNMHYSIPLAGYHNSFEDVVKNVNALLHRNTEDINAMRAELLKVSDGDFTVHMDDSAWPGEWAEIPKTVNILTDNLNNVSNEINSMIDAAAVKGNLAYHINEAGYKGDWGRIMQGLNSIAEAVNNPIVEIRDIMGKLGRGEFGTKVVGNYAGDFLQIKNAVNSMIDDLTGYMDEVAVTLEAVAGGDLTKTITREYLGGFSRLKDSLNNITNTLHKTMEEINSASEQVLMGAKQISTSAQDLANGAQSQASSVEELNASIDLITTQTKDNADSANNANTLSDKSTANATEGNESMKEMLTAMEQIKDSSNNISKIIKSIQDIAFQTNLLALNAAVEAARAGEHGKGFAVVAEEVRNLAARSQSAATETTGLIQESITRVESGSEIAASTSESLDTIVKGAGEISAIINSISNASSEQAEAISQVSIGLNQISQVVQNNSAVSQETAAASEELNSQAELLQQLVSYFKLRR
ncbi:MAG: methyl-accepting chemotaxis protein [Defluviitaleaceae bacterium]|nr:methyl-accepting chemotaxis protein [Defluviitaleaceae bacterium]MCL2261833.1 methyl-accepting chemotaxis protein [Defluviitaleaceae bacterium]